MAARAHGVLFPRQYDSAAFDVDLLDAALLLLNATDTDIWSAFVNRSNELAAAVSRNDIRSIMCTGQPGCAAADPLDAPPDWSMDLLFDRIVFPIIIVFGLVGTSLTVVVLTRRQMRSTSTNVYLTVLSLSDLIYIVMFALQVAHRNELFVSLEFCYISLYGVPLMNVVSYNALWITATFTTERFLAITHPLKTRHWVRPRRASLVSGIVFTLCAVLTIPEMFAETIEYSDRGPECKVTNTDLGNTWTYSVLYVAAEIVLFTALPMLVIVFFNTMLVRSVLSANKMRATLGWQRGQTQAANGTDDAAQERGGARGGELLRKSRLVANTGVSGWKGSGSGGSGRQQADSRRITVMLIAIVVAFTICQLPVSIAHVWRTALRIHDSNATGPPELAFMGNTVGNALLLLNSAINFLLFSCFSARFRQQLALLFRWPPCACHKVAQIVADYSRRRQTHNANKPVKVTGRTAAARSWALRRLAEQSSSHSHSHSQSQLASPNHNPHAMDNSMLTLDTGHECYVRGTIRSGRLGDGWGGSHLDVPGRSASPLYQCRSKQPAERHEVAAPRAKHIWEPQASTLERGAAPFVARLSPLLSQSSLNAQSPNGSPHRPRSPSDDNLTDADAAAQPCGSNPCVDLSHPTLCPTGDDRFYVSSCL